jgi:peptidoglycan hydrolase CwlO-like protein
MKKVFACIMLTSLMSAPAMAIDSAMAEKLQQRLDQLKAEYTAGLRMREDLQAKLNNLDQTLLRINGAIQVLEEELAQD